MNAVASTVEVEVVFALPGRLWRRRLYLSQGATAGEAVVLSGLDAICLRECGHGPAALGVYGRKVAEDHAVGQGDRVEIYRVLTVNPRERRRQRAQKR